MDKNRSVFRQRRRRKWRVRRDIAGTTERPRLCVFRSHKHISCQLIDDSKGVTLVAAGTLDGDIADSVKYGGNVKAATIVGDRLAEAAKSKGVKQVCFDRGPYNYHGRVKALAEAVRKGGIQF